MPVSREKGPPTPDGAFSARCCPRFTSLSVVMTLGNVTDAAISEIAQNCRRFSFLTMSGYESTKITEESLALLPRSCRLEGVETSRLKRLRRWPQPPKPREISYE